MRLFTLLILIAGCSFRPTDAPAVGDGAVPPIDAAHDASHTTQHDAPAIPFCDPNDSTLVACYEFENVLTDGSPHHLDPNVMKNVTFGPGAVGNAAVIGLTTEVDVAESSLFGVSALTIEAWIDPIAIPTGTARAGVLDCDGRYGVFVHSNGDLSCSAGSSLTVSAQIQVARWTHVACTQDGTTERIYVDGSLVGSVTATPLSLTGSQTGITLGGNNPANGGDPLDGSLDQVRLFGAARSSAEICADAGRTSCM